MMKLKILFFLLFSLTVRADEVLTYTWSLDANNNSSNFKLLTEFDPTDDNSWDGYLIPSTTKLVTEDLNEHWISDNHAAESRDLSVIYRTRGSFKTISQPYPETMSIVQHWPFIRKFISFGGEAGTGAHVVAPDPIYVDQAHSNGVKIYGTVFLAPTGHGGNVDMASNLFGGLGRDSSTECPTDGDPTLVSQNWPSSQLVKLADIARKLNLDGWFINLESIDDYYGTSHYNHLLLKAIGRQTSCFLPKFNTPTADKEPVEFIIYMPNGGGSYGIPTDAVDGNIYNMGGSVEGNTNGVNAGSIQANFSPSNKYLMFLDQPFWQNSHKSPYVLARYDAAKSTSCQYFKGVTNSYGTWEGFTYYAKARYPNSLGAEKLVCAGDAIANDNPDPEYVLNITMPSTVDLSISVPNTDGKKYCYAGDTCRITFKEQGKVTFKFTSGFRFRKAYNSWEGEIKYLDLSSLWLDTILTPYSDNTIPARGYLCDIKLTKTVHPNAFGDGLTANMYEGECSFTFSKEMDEYGFWKSYYPMLNGSMNVKVVPR